MKSNVSVGALTIVCIMGLSTLFSQPGAGPCFKETGRPNPFLDVPGLTGEQESAIKLLQQQFRIEMAAIREDESKAREDIREIFLLKRSDLHAQIEKLYTPAQIEFMKNRPDQQSVSRPSFQKPQVKSRFTDENDRFLLRHKRSDFEKLLTPEEKLVIDNARQKVKAHREFMTGLNRFEVTPEERGEIREAHMQELQPVKDIAQKYRTEIMALHKDGLPGNPSACPNYSAKPGSGRFQGRRPANHRQLHPGVGFLLLEPLDIDNEMINQGNQDFNIYPNPVIKGFTAEFKVENGGVVTIELLNKTGEVIGILEKADRNQGINSFTYGGELLTQPGIYFVRIQTSNATMIRKLIRN